MCFRDMQMDMEPYPKHWLSILIEWIVSSGLVIQTVSILSPWKLVIFCVIYFISSIHFLTQRLYMCVNVWENGISYVKQSPCCNVFEVY